MNTADLILAKDKVMNALKGLDEIEPHAFDRVFAALADYEATAYELGRWSVLSRTMV
jgi:hypothetical protein